MLDEWVRYRLERRCGMHNKAPPKGGALCLSRRMRCAPRTRRHSWLEALLQALRDGVHELESIRLLGVLGGGQAHQVAGHGATLDGVQHGLLQLAGELGHL